MLKGNILVFLLISLEMYQCGKQKMPYMDMQHATIAYYDPNYITNITYTIKRHNRQNPLYFQTINLTIIRPVDNTFSMNFYIYELLSNVYKRSFVEIHLNYCDFMNNDNIFGRIVKSTNFKAVAQCPLPPGQYNLTNMTSPFGQFLRAFPFKQGRVYLNVTETNHKVFLAGYADMQIKEMAAVDFYKYIE